MRLKLQDTKEAFRTVLGGDKGGERRNVERRGLRKRVEWARVFGSSAPVSARCACPKEINRDCAADRVTDPREPLAVALPLAPLCDRAGLGRRRKVSSRMLVILMGVYQLDFETRATTE